MKGGTLSSPESDVINRVSIEAKRLGVSSLTATINIS